MKYLLPFAALAAVLLVFSDVGEATLQGPPNCNSSSAPIPISSSGAISRKFCTQAEAEDPAIVEGIKQSAAEATVASQACPSCPGPSVGCFRSIKKSFGEGSVQTYHDMTPTSTCPNGTYFIIVSWDSGLAWIECSTCSFPNPS